MRSISFAWTATAYRARAKRRTRRTWQTGYAASWKVLETFGALDKDRRAGGGLIGEGFLLSKPYWQPGYEIDLVADYELEGFAWLDAHPQYKPPKWQEVTLIEVLKEMQQEDGFWVVDFEPEVVYEPWKEGEGIGKPMHKPLKGG